MYFLFFRVCMPDTKLLYNIAELEETTVAELTATPVVTASNSAGAKTTVPPAIVANGRITRKRKCVEEVTEKIADKVTKRGKKGTPLKAAKTSLVTKPVKTAKTAEKPAETKGSTPKPASKKSNGGEKIEVVFSFDTTGI